METWAQAWNADLWTLVWFKGAEQRDFDELILASPIILIIGAKLFFIVFDSKKMLEFYIKTTVKESIL